MVLKGYMALQTAVFPNGTKGVVCITQLFLSRRTVKVGNFVLHQLRI